MAGFDENVKNVNISFMMSDGGLCPVEHFSGFRSILSGMCSLNPSSNTFIEGPAGGVVGYSMTTWDPSKKQPVIGFDMGGTSTDVSRFDGNYNHVYDTEIAGTHFSNK